MSTEWLHSVYVARTPSHPLRLSLCVSPQQSLPTQPGRHNPSGRAQKFDWPEHGHAQPADHSELQPATHGRAGEAEDASQGHESEPQREYDGLTE